MKSLTDVISGIILLVLCGIGAWSVSTLPESGMEQLGPGAFPKMILVPLVILSFILIVQGFRKAPAKSYWPEAKVFKKILLFIGLFYFYLITFTELGDLFLNMENPPFNANASSWKLSPWRASPRACWWASSPDSSKSSCPDAPSRRADFPTGYSDTATGRKQIQKPSVSEGICSRIFLTAS